MKGNVPERFIPDEPQYLGDIDEDNLCIKCGKRPIADIGGPFDAKGLCGVCNP